MPDTFVRFSMLFSFFLLFSLLSPSFHAGAAERQANLESECGK